MNYLAHIFLSGNQSKVMVGNFIGDFVKGSRYNVYPAEIKNGILLHRLIDEFTDNHPVVQSLNRFLRPTFGRYSAIILDMYFDYLLAKNFKNYSTISLHLFSIRFYLVVLWNYKHLPNRVKGFIFHFVTTNRLKKYGTLAGLQSSLQIMANHKIPTLNPPQAISFLKQNHSYIEREFFVFFIDLKAFSNYQLKFNNRFH